MSDLQSLQDEKRQLEKTRDEAAVKFHDAQTLLQKINIRLKELNSEIGDCIRLTRLKSQKPSVTDHAFLRYVERVMEWPINTLKAELLKKLPNPLPNGTIVIDGIKFVCRDNQLITVYEKPEYGKYTLNH